MLDKLIDYHRAAVPKLEAGWATFEHERQMVCAYLELMRMRMPDRLGYTVHIDPAALALHCPPMALITLVENAISTASTPARPAAPSIARDGARSARCWVRVADTGVGLQPRRGGQSGTGLSNLREAPRTGLR